MLSEHLASLNLSQYLGKLQEQGLVDLSQLLLLPETDLEMQLTAFGLLKGHAIKLKCSIDTLRAKAKAGLSSAPAVRQPLQRETEQLLQKRAEVDKVRQSIEKCRAMILNVDIGGYRRTLESIETLQETMKQMEVVEKALGC